MMNAIAICILIVVALITGSTHTFIFTSASVSGSAEVGPQGNATNSKYLQIKDHSFTEGLLFTIINGTVSNNSSSTINLATVYVEFYDNNNSLITISSSTADFPILNPGDSSLFDIRSELGAEVVDHYMVKPGGNIAP